MSEKKPYTGSMLSGCMDFTENQTTDAAAVIDCLKATFERWLEIGPNKQPRYRNGLRPWSTGDLRYLIDGLEAARIACTPTAVDGPPQLPDDLEGELGTTPIPLLIRRAAEPDERLVEQLHKATGDLLAAIADGNSLTDPAIDHAYERCHQIWSDMEGLIASTPTAVDGDMVVQVARAICTAEGFDPDLGSTRGVVNWWSYMDAAHAALSVIAPSIRAKALEDADNYVLPCDVKVPPATIIGAGCTLATLKLALSLEGRPRKFSDVKPLDPKHPLRSLKGEQSC